jgi:hypothetical protein
LFSDSAIKARFLIRYAATFPDTIIVYIPTIALRKPRFPSVKARFLGICSWRADSGLPAGGNDLMRFGFAGIGLVVGRFHSAASKKS